MSEQNKNKIRLDVYLHDNGFFPSREKARIAIMEGKVFVNNQKEDKPGTLVKKLETNILVKDDSIPYVSRGGFKLEKATKEFNLIYTDKICVDIGSSTGGFTDLMLKNGAKKVYAVDCGTNQLDYRLRTDSRVIVMENTNARYLTNNVISEPIDFISIDVSFISLDKILPVVKLLLRNGGLCCMLIKPQFEAGRELVNEGVVKNKKIHIDVINKVLDSCINNKLKPKDLTFSPIKGPAGNIEYLLLVSNDDDDTSYNLDVEKIVSLSHEELD